MPPLLLLFICDFTLLSFSTLVSFSNPIYPFLSKFMLQVKCLEWKLNPEFHFLNASPSYPGKGYVALATHGRVALILRMNGSDRM